MTLPPILTFTLDLSVDVSCFATGWATALQRGTKVPVDTISLQAETPKAVSIRIGPAPVAVRSYTFPELPGWSESPLPNRVERVAAPADLQSSPPRRPAALGFARPATSSSCRTGCTMCCSHRWSHWSTRAS